jgi:hypothetical protein
LSIQLKIKLTPLQCVSQFFQFAHEYRLQTIQVQQSSRDDYDIDQVASVLMQIREEYKSAG